MKIMILTVGSRGDVQPFVALGQGLKAAGHAVTLGAPALFESFATHYGLNFAGIDDELIRLKDTDEGRKAMEGSGGKMALMKKVKPMLRRMLDDAWAASQGAEALIYHPKTLAGYHIAEALGVPAFMSMPLPLYTPTSAFPTPILASLRLGRVVNRLSYSAVRFVTAPFMGTVNEWRQSVLGLPRRPRFANELVRPDGRPVPTLYSYSPQVVPTPADWPDTTVATGYWFLNQPDRWTPPAGLVDFLKAGPAPVYIGFGSMAGTNPEAKARLVIDALKRAGQRGLIASGWGGLKAGDLPDSLFMIEEAPHDWLLPQVAAVVHHGGAGTTAAGLRAGKPTVICPFLGDQPFWGRRVYELGVGPAPIPQKRLTADHLAQAIQNAVTDESMRRRAAELGEQIRAEDGVAVAVSIIHRTLGVSNPTSARVPAAG